MKIEIVGAPFMMVDEDFAKVVAWVVHKKVVKKPAPSKHRVAGFLVGDIDVFCGTITLPEATTEKTVNRILEALKKHNCKCQVM